MQETSKISVPFPSLEDELKNGIRVFVLERRQYQETREKVYKYIYNLLN